VKRIVCLIGPTAVGKTAAVASLSDIPVEIISADSMQMYRGMDIGTAKPPKSIQREIPHHLIDCLDPSVYYSVGNFVHDCEQCIEDITTRGHIPLLTGGTPFYIKHFLYGLPKTPPACKSIRKYIRKKVHEQGVSKYWEKLKQIDPKTADKIHPNDLYRITRAWEVYLETGRTLSSFQIPSCIRKDYKILLIGLFLERSVLKQRLKERVQKMQEQGLDKEVHNLLDKGRNLSDPGMRAIGYREFCLTPLKQEERYWTTDQIESIVTSIFRNSWHYAKKQMAFFRSFPQVLWVHAESIKEIKNIIKGFIWES